LLHKPTSSLTHSLTHSFIHTTFTLTHTHYYLSKMEKKDDGHMQSEVMSDTVRVNNFSVCLVLLACIGGFLFGYDTGIISGSIVLIADDFDLR
jgi:hypothetical protein